jgi:hypothetical protein
MKFFVHITIYEKKICSHNNSLEKSLPTLICMTQTLWFINKKFAQINVHDLNIMIQKEYFCIN